MEHTKMIRAALIGLGHIAWKYDANNSVSTFALSQAGAIKRRTDLQLVGGCSPCEKDRAGFHCWSEGLPVYETPEAMLSELHPDFVGICSPTILHHKHAQLCLKNGIKLLWLEKPPAENLEQVKSLIDLAESTNATVCVNYFRRYLPQYKNLQFILQNNLLGKCHAIRILYSPGIRSNGVHLLDQIFFLSSAKSYELLWVEKGGHPDNPSFALRLDSGLLVHAVGSALPYHSNDISMVCDEGIISVIRGGKQTRLEKRTENDLFPGFYEVIENDLVSFGETCLNGYMDTALEDLMVSAKNYQQPASNLHSSFLSQELLEKILWLRRQ